MKAAKTIASILSLLAALRALSFADSVHDAQMESRQNGNDSVAGLNERSPPKVLRAKDSKDRSIRVSYGNAPGIEDDSIRDDGGAQVEILQVWRSLGESDARFGWLVGGGLFFSQHRGVDEYGDHYENWAFGFMVEGGGVARLGDHLVFELLPYVGFGTDVIGAAAGDEGGYYLYGVKGGAFVLLGKTVELGLEVGYAGYSVEYAAYSGSIPRIAAVVAVNF